MKTELKVGDQLFADTRYHGLALVTVERLTKTTAVLSDGEKLDNPTFDHVKSKGSSGGYISTYYRLITDSLKEQYTRQNALRKVKAIKWDDISTEQLLTLITTLNK